MRREVLRLTLELPGGFPGGLVVRIRCFHCHGLRSTPGQETEIPERFSS